MKKMYRYFRKRRNTLEEKIYREHDSLYFYLALIIGAYFGSKNKDVYLTYLWMFLFITPISLRRMYKYIRQLDEEKKKQGTDIFDEKYKQ